MLREFAENIKAGLAECRLSANFQRFGKCWITLFSVGSILSDIALFSTSKAAFNIVCLIKNCEKLSHFHKILCYFLMMNYSEQSNVKIGLDMNVSYIPYVSYWDFVSLWSVAFSYFVDLIYRTHLEKLAHHFLAWSRNANLRIM